MITSAFTIKQAIKYGSDLLAAVSDSALLDSQILLAFSLGKDRSYLLSWPEKLLADEVQSLFIKLLKRRAQHEPVAYLVGHKEFWSLELDVAPSTLIPRPDTEVLVEQVLQDITSEQARCLDLGTGTGAIALALASENKKWQFDAVDLMPEAVTLAKKNAKKLNINNVNIYQSSWFENIDKSLRFDVIVSNPPYIDANDPHLAQGDVTFEPVSALVAKNNGLADIEHIASKARSYLTPGGSLYFEHGFEQGQLVRDILTSLGYDNAATIQDYNNNDRVTYARFNQ